MNVFNNMNGKKILSPKIVLQILLCSSVCAGISASEVDIPNNFTAGTAAVAAEVNENFSALESAVDDNHQVITTLQAEIDALQVENADLQSEVTKLQNASAIARPVFPRQSDSLNYLDYRIEGLKGVFTVQFNIAMDPTTFVVGDNVTVSGGGGIGTGTIAWKDSNSTLEFTMTENFLTIYQCSPSPGLNFTIKGSGDNPVLDVQGKPLDGDGDGLRGGDFELTFGYVC